MATVIFYLICLIFVKHLVPSLKMLHPVCWRTTSSLIDWHIFTLLKFLGNIAHDLLNPCIKPFTSLSKVMSYTHSTFQKFAIGCRLPRLLEAPNVFWQNFFSCLQFPCNRRVVVIAYGWHQWRKEAEYEENRHWENTYLLLCPTFPTLNSSLVTRVV